LREVRIFIPDIHKNLTPDACIVRPVGTHSAATSSAVFAIDGPIGVYAQDWVSSDLGPTLLEQATGNTMLLLGVTAAVQGLSWAGRIESGPGGATVPRLRSEVPQLQLGYRRVAFFKVKGVEEIQGLRPLATDATLSALALVFSLPEAELTSGLAAFSQLFQSAKFDLGGGGAPARPNSWSTRPPGPLPT